MLDPDDRIPANDGVHARDYRNDLLVTPALADIARNLPARPVEVATEHLEELGRLVDTAGADIVGTLMQRLDSRHPRFYIGEGKAEELRLLAEETGLIMNLGDWVIEEACRAASTWVAMSARRKSTAWWSAMILPKVLRCWA